MRDPNLASHLGAAREGRPAEGAAGGRRTGRRRGREPRQDVQRGGGGQQVRPLPRGVALQEELGHLPQRFVVFFT